MTVVCSAEAMTGPSGLERPGNGHTWEVLAQKIFSPRILSRKPDCPGKYRPLAWIVGMAALTVSICESIFLFLKRWEMVIISKTILARFARRHPEAGGALNEWYRKVKQADWSSFADVRRTFASVDYVGNDRFVFDIRGNRYRMVVMIFFDIRTVFIRFIGTHAAYDNIEVESI